MTTDNKVSTKVTNASTEKDLPASKPVKRSPARRRATTKTLVKRVAATTLNDAAELSTKIENLPAVSVGRTVVTTKQVVAKKSKITKKLKDGKVKMERDSFTMPKEEYAQLAILKARLEKLGQPAKKSELLRAGIKLLTAMTDARLKTTLAAVPVIKTGRPKKKK